jgi:hypothetical protein
LTRALGSDSMPAPIPCVIPDMPRSGADPGPTSRRR